MRVRSFLRAHGDGAVDGADLGTLLTLWTN